MSDVMVKHPIEQWLDDRSVDYVLTEIRTDQVNIKASRDNQARFEALVDDLPKLYSAAMKRGDEFPPLVGYQNGNADGVILIDGNNRLEAGRFIGRETFPIYLVDCPADVRQELTYEANYRLNGRENTLEERTAHAVHLVHLGSRQSDAARKVGLSTNAVRNAVATKEADIRFNRLGMAKALKMSPSMRRMLASLNLDPTLKALANAIGAGKIGHDPAKALIAELNALCSEADQLARVAEAAADRDSAKLHPAAKMTPRRSLIMHAAALAKIDPAMLRLSAIDSDDRATLRGKLNELADRIAEMDDALR